MEENITTVEFELRKTACSAVAQIISGMIQTKEWSFNSMASVNETFDLFYVHILKKLKE